MMERRGNVRSTRLNGLENCDSEFKVPTTSAVKRKKNDDDLINDKHSKRRTGLDNRNNLQNNKQVDESYLIKYAPKSKNDLVVDKKKLAAIENWFQMIYEQKDLDDRILVLYGPTGSSKTTTIRVLAEHYDVKLFEFEEKSQTFTKTLEEKQHLEYTGNQLDQLQKFVTCANSCISKKDRERRKAILIKDIPSTFLNNLDEFHQFIKSYLKLFRRGAAIIFVITLDDTMTVNQLKKLFPLESQPDLSLYLVELNSVIKKQIKSVLERINSSGLVDKKDLDILIESSNGDLRSAINALEFLVKSNNCSNQFEMQNFLDKIDTPSVLLTKDISPTFFHMLGKIMYCKREGDELVKSSRSTKSSRSKVNTSFDALSLGIDERRKLKETPEEIVNLIETSGETLCTFLHESYLDFVDDLTNAADLVSNLSLVDSNYSDAWQFSELDDYAKLIAIRGTMFNLNTKEPTQKKRQFKSFTRPQLYSIASEQEKFNNLINERLKKEDHRFRSREELIEILSFKERSLFSKLK